MSGRFARRLRLVEKISSHCSLPRELSPALLVEDLDHTDEAVFHAHGDREDRARGESDLLAISG